jgi:hypothetical protein
MGPQPFSASLDKIEPSKGYTKNNSRFILWGCNALKGVGADEDMYAIALRITKTSPSIVSAYAGAILALPG